MTDFEIEKSRANVNSFGIAYCSQLQSLRLIWHSLIGKQVFNKNHKSPPNQHFRVARQL